MIYPTLPIEIWKKTGTDAFSQPKFSASAISEKVCPVKLNFSATHTTVRTDSAGSHGHAGEDTADVVVLAGPKTQIETGDKLIVLGHALRVKGMHPRFTVRGLLDHHQVTCGAWT